MFPMIALNNKKIGGYINLEKMTSRTTNHALQQQQNKAANSTNCQYDVNYKLIDKNSRFVRIRAAKLNESEIARQNTDNCEDTNDGQRDEFELDYDDGVVTMRQKIKKI